MVWSLTGVLFALAVLACTRVADDEPIAEPDVYLSDAYEPPLDVAWFDAAKDTAKTTKDVIDIGPKTKEACNNQLDDDGDGLTDEEGCFPTPNLRTDLSFTDLGLVAIAKSPGAAPTRVFDLAIKNQGTLLTAQDLTSGDKQYVWAETLVSPAGIDYLTPGEWQMSANRGFVEIGHATTLIGMSPQISVVAGPWTVGFTRADVMPLQFKGTPSAGFLRLGAVSRVPIPANVKGKFDLDVFCVGGAPMPCGELAKSPQWQQITARINSIWAPAGVELGEVQLFDLGGDAGKSFRFLDNVESAGPDNELNQVYLATGQQRPTSTAVTLVLVSSIAGSTTSVAGLSKLAGVPGWVGSRLGGMAVAFDETIWQDTLAQGPESTVAGEIWGTTIAHEIGHFLGLWHTDELDGVLHDPIDDTPACAVSGSTNVSAQNCPVQAKYLMFPQVTPSSTVISAGQAKVARLSPALRP